jgi:hypothetical protein
MHPDDVLESTYPFYRPESAQIFRQLPDVKPKTLYIFGSESPFSAPETRKAKVESTGRGGGKKDEEVVVLGGGHLVAFEKVGLVGEAVTRFAGGELERWEREKEEPERRWKGKNRIERAQIDEVWKERVGRPPGKMYMKENL